jgi:hypothetical protein
MQASVARILPTSELNGCNSMLVNFNPHIHIFGTAALQSKHGSLALALRRILHPRHHNNSPQIIRNITRKRRYSSNRHHSSRLGHFKQPSQPTNPPLLDLSHQLQLLDLLLMRSYRG